MVVPRLNPSGKFEFILMRGWWAAASFPDALVDFYRRTPGRPEDPA
jgi:hypothetical protein